MMRPDPSPSENWNPLVPELMVSSVEASLRVHKAAGFAVFREPANAWYEVDPSHEEGQIEVLAQDPDGYLLRLLQVLGSRAK